MGAVIPRDGFKEIRRDVGFELLIGQLARVTRIREITIDQPWSYAVGEDRLDRGKADPNLAGGLKAPK